MRFSPENIIGKNSYPDKKSEELSERQEKKANNFNNTESSSDYNKIKIVEAKNAVHPENRYNSVEEEEKIDSPNHHWVSSEDNISEDEDNIISKIDERMLEERAEIEEIAELRDCGFFDIIDKLLKTVDKKGDNSEKENILNRLQSFIVEYKAILDNNLPNSEEEQKIKQSFDENFGAIAYSSDGSAELVNEMMMVVKNAPKNRWRGEKISQPEDKIASSKPTKFIVEKKSAPENKLGVKKDGSKWPGTNIFRKIKIKW